MKHYIIYSILIIVFLVESIYAVVLKDVSPTIPEYEAVKFMVEEGIMDADKGYFKGPQVVTKFDLAVYLYKFYKYMRYSIPVSSSAPVSEEKGKTVKVISDQRVDVILKLLKYDPKANDFDRLNTIEKKLTGMEDMLTSLVKEIKKGPDISKFDEKIASINAKLSVLENEVSKLKEERSKSTEKVSDEIAEIQNKIAKYDVLLKSHEEAISEGNESMNEIKRSYLELKEEYNDLQSETSSLVAEVNTLKYAMHSYAVKIDSHENALLNIRAQLSELMDKIETSSATPSAESTASSMPEDLKKYVEKLEEMQNEIEDIKKIKEELKSKLDSIENLSKEMEVNRNKIDYAIKSMETISTNQNKLTKSANNLFILTIFSIVLSSTAIIVAVLF